MTFVWLARLIVVGFSLLAPLPSAAQQGAGATLRLVPHADLAILDPYWTGVTGNCGYMNQRSTCSRLSTSRAGSRVRERDCSLTSD